MSFSTIHLIFIFLRQKWDTHVITAVPHAYIYPSLERKVDHKEMFQNIAFNEVCTWQNETLGLGYPRNQEKHLCKLGLTYQMLIKRLAVNGLVNVYSIQYFYSGNIGQKKK